MRLPRIVLMAFWRGNDHLHSIGVLCVVPMSALEVQTTWLVSSAGRHIGMLVAACMQYRVLKVLSRMRIFLVCRNVMLAFMWKLEVDYNMLFTCPACKDRPHDQLIITVDGKEMGVQHSRAQPYNAPRDASVVVKGPMYAETQICTALCTGYFQH